MRHAWMLLLLAATSCADSDDGALDEIEGRRRNTRSTACQEENCRLLQSTKLHMFTFGSNVTKGDARRVLVHDADNDVMVVSTPDPARNYAYDVARKAEGWGSYGLEDDYTNGAFV